MSGWVVWLGWFAIAMSTRLVYIFIQLELVSRVMVLVLDLKLILVDQPCTLSIDLPRMGIGWLHQVVSVFFYTLLTAHFF